jgi:hypothetical protein
MKNQFIVTTVLTLLIFCSCKKSPDKEYSKWAGKADQVWRTTVTNWAITNGVSLQTNSQVLDFADKMTEALKSDVAKELAIGNAQAGQFLLKLLKNDQLPGVSKDEHGQLTTDQVPVVVSNKLVEISYPMERTLHLVKNGENFTNNYTVVKLAKDLEWTLQKAWLTDSNGQTIQEWPVK